MASQEIKEIKESYNCLYTVGHQTTDLYLTYCGVENCSPTHSFGPVWRNEYVIHFVSAGHGYLQIENTEFEIHANQAFLVPAHITTYYHADPDDPYCYAWIAFAGKNTDQYLKATPLSPEHPVYTLNTPVSEFYTIILNMLKNRKQDLPSDIERTACLYHILSVLSSANQDALEKNIPSIHSPDDYIDLSLQFIKKNYDHISISDVVDYIGITRSWLYTLFKKKLNTSPQEYLISYRLEKASQLLLSTDLCIEDVALQVGYVDTLTFSKAFKKNFSITPAKYRKTHLEKGD